MIKAIFYHSIFCLTHEDDADSDFFEYEYVYNEHEDEFRDFWIDGEKLTRLSE